MRECLERLTYREYITYVDYIGLRDSDQLDKEDKPVLPPPSPEKQLSIQKAIWRGRLGLGRDD